MAVVPFCVYILIKMSSDSAKRPPPPHEQKSPLWAVKSLPASCRLSVFVSQSFFKYTFFALSSSCQRPCYIPVFRILLHRSHLFIFCWQPPLIQEKKWQNFLPPSCVCVSSLKQHGCVQTSLIVIGVSCRGHVWSLVLEVYNIALNEKFVNPLIFVSQSDSSVWWGFPIEPKIWEVDDPPVDCHHLRMHQKKLTLENSEYFSSSISLEMCNFT